MLHPIWSLSNTNVFIEKVYEQLETDNVSTVSSVGKDISCPDISGKLIDCCPKNMFSTAL